MFNMFLKGAILCGLVAFCLAIAVFFPVFDPEEVIRLDDEFRRNDNNLTVASFNIRLDAFEADPNLHFRQRKPRIAKFFQDLRPTLVGLQEPFNNQIYDLLPLLPHGYKVIGYSRPGHVHMIDPVRFYDFQTSIVYDSNRLDLLTQDHIWLSETPRVEGSTFWSGKGAKTLTIGLFKRKFDGKLIVHLNTHLDVFVAQARNRQAILVEKTGRDYATQYPDALVIISGDFNCASGHAQHNVLLNSSIFFDSWDVCRENCFGNSFASSFHGWMGPFVNTYVARIIQGVLHSLHSAGVDLPRQVPNSLMEFLRIGKPILSHLANPVKVWKTMPKTLARQHVDWVISNRPDMVQMAYVRAESGPDFLSDHFPVMVKFKLLVDLNK